MTDIAPRPSAAVAPSSAEDRWEAAFAAYTYAYPLVLMELTRRTQLATGTMATAMNTIDHRRAYLDHTFTDVVRPNADTLYTTLWFDVSREPLVISVPGSGGRYYLLQLLDLWTDTFAVPGSRTTGDDAQTLVLARRGWTGDLPEGAILIHCPTPVGWMIGRIQANGPADYAGVHAFQDGFAAAPLGSAGAAVPVPAHEHGGLPPVEQVARMDTGRFFAFFAELLATNPPHENDYAMVHRLARLGIEPGRPFDIDAVPAATRAALEEASVAALAAIRNPTGGATTRNGWRTVMSAIGTYGTDYGARARVAYAGLGANPVDDALYPRALTDADGEPFSSDRRYVLHFAADEIPPVRAFWSLTMYDDRQLFTANPLGRYAIGDRDDLEFNADGSLDLLIQRESPGADREANWLPAPAQGGFTMNLRLYWPTLGALSGAWTAPPVVRVG